MNYKLIVRNAENKKGRKEIDDVIVFLEASETIGGRLAVEFICAARLATSN